MHQDRTLPLREDLRLAARGLRWFVLSSYLPDFFEGSIKLFIYSFRKGIANILRQYKNLLDGFKRFDASSDGLYRVRVPDGLYRARMR